MNNDKYSMSFTTGSLFYLESVKLAELFIALEDWNAVRNKVLSENLLQARTQNTSKRVCREIISRLKTLTPLEIDLLINGSPQEQTYLLWIAVCRRYKFIADFAVEIIRENYLSLKTDLTHQDFDSFFNKKSECHSELDKIKPTTKNKLRQILFKILREVDLLTANNTINAAMPSPRLVETLLLNERQDLLLFPMFESNLKGLKK
jgi:hypothetical protein